MLNNRYHQSKNQKTMLINFTGKFGSTNFAILLGCNFLLLLLLDFVSAPGAVGVGSTFSSSSYLL
jgi:hypothetical protein